MRSKVLVLLFVLVANPPWPACSADRLVVNMTLVRNAAAYGAFCLDGSLPAYHLSRGFGAGGHNWLLQFEGGGWCNDLEMCFERAHTRRGSTRYMNKLEDFNGILSNNASLNPDFYNWNRVKIRYCDGASFIGDSKFDNGTHELYFKGHKIWEAVIIDLLPKGLARATKGLLSGCSAGGLASFLHCEHFKKLLPNATAVKCLSDAGFFLDERDISLNHTQRYFYEKLIQLQGAVGNLNKNCTNYYNDPELCIFPQYLLKYIQTPLFILNTAYDVYQFHHILVPPSADPEGHWNQCKVNVKDCDKSQLKILQGFREDLLGALELFTKDSSRVGMFINSCFAHCQSESQATWFTPDSPKINNKTIAEAVGDWYFGRSISKEIDGPYPCNPTCYNLIPAAKSASVHDSLVNLGCLVLIHVLSWLFSPTG